PAQIDPKQSFLEGRAMRHEVVPGVEATIRMEGDVWETEDHRNWSDASFKTYCRPLVQPWPYTIPGGSEVRHTATFSFAGRLPAAGASAAARVSVRLGQASGPLPRLGLGVLPENAELALRCAAVASLAGVQHLNCRVDLRAADWQAALPHYRE